MHVEHVALWARDLERLRAFYETQLGGTCGPRYENPRTGFTSYFVSFAGPGGTRVELMTVSDARAETAGTKAAPGTNATAAGSAVGGKNAVAGSNAAANESAVAGSNAVAVGSVAAVGGGADAVDRKTAEAVPEAPTRGYAHLAVCVGAAEAVDAAVERMRANGVTIAALPRRTGDGYYEAVVLDPEGNRIELVAGSPLPRGAASGREGQCEVPGAVVRGLSAAAARGADARRRARQRRRGPRAWRGDRRRGR